MTSFDEFWSSLRKTFGEIDDVEIINSSDELLVILILKGLGRRIFFERENSYVSVEIQREAVGGSLEAVQNPTTDNHYIELLNLDNSISARIENRQFNSVKELVEFYVYIS